MNYYFYFPEEPSFCVDCLMVFYALLTDAIEKGDCCVYADVLMPMYSM